MADLRSIMNVDEEHHDARVNKRDRGPSSPRSRLSRQSHPPSASDHPPPGSIPVLQHHQHHHHQHHQQQQPHTLQPHHPHQQQQQQHQRPYYHRDPPPHVSMDPNFPPYDRRVSPFGHPSPIPGEDFSSASSSSRISTGHHHLTNTTYRGSNTPDEMDHQGFSYGHHIGISSSMSPPSVRAPMAMRSFNGVPMEPQQGLGAPKLTPVTGRVSKALKGVPVHTCHQCDPPRVSASFSPRLFP